jgi:hypothetical protein
MKAQSAIEFITAYSWAFLLIILAAFVAFYYLSSQQPKPECNFGVDLPCPSFQFFKNSSGGMRLLFQLSNGMGKEVSFRGNQIITVQNIGKSGLNNYSGICRGYADMIKGGDPVFCAFNITDKEMMPSTGKNVKFSVTLNYTDCETAPNYPLGCDAGLNRNPRGAITTPLELRPVGLTSYCGDGFCTSPENYTNCPWDCEPPKPTFVFISSTSDCMTQTRMHTDKIQITVTVQDQNHQLMKDVPVVIFLQDDVNPGTTQHIQYTITPLLLKTDSSGVAHANFTWDSCTPQIPICFPLFTLGASAGSASGFDPECSYLSSGDASASGCC